MSAQHPQQQPVEVGEDMNNNITAVTCSLTSSFSLVPPEAIPAILDCILTSSSISTLSLFNSLLNSFSIFTKGIAEEDEGVDSSQYSYIGSIIAALCHLVKKSGNANVLQTFIWRGFLPVLKVLNENDHELLNSITELLCGVVIESNSWTVTEMTLVPSCFMSIRLPTTMLENDESVVNERNGDSSFKGSNGKLSHSDVLTEHMPALPVSLSKAMACHILTSLLTASLRSNQPKTASVVEPVVENGFYAENFAIKLHSDLCDMTVRMLSETPEHRSSAIRFLLPSIFIAFTSICSVKISEHGQKPADSRAHFFEKIWKCCRKMFSLGPLGRKDAYNVLSLYLSHAKGFEVDVADNGINEFNIRDEKEFWDEIKQGLVDKEGFVRKQSLHILKTAVQRSDASQCCTSVSEATLDESSANATTKRGQWAEKEAKSLGVGQICKPDDTCLSGQQRWEAFILLYEMLEEYGTHLVEAAWNHQISLLLTFSSDIDSSTNPAIEVHQMQLKTVEGTFRWLAVLWERGLCHENPQVRCLIMQSILGIDWRNFGNCSKAVAQSFVFGSFIQGLNDPVHHRDFGSKGVYTSQPIEGATNFLHHFCSYYTERERIAFLSSLASLVKQESFGRAGLMALSFCIASSACGPDTHDMDSSLSADGSSLDNEKALLLDSLRLVIESSKQHFNPNYRLQVCEKVLEAASSVMYTSDVPVETLMHFIAKVPREFTDYGGSLREKVKEWLSKCEKKNWQSDSKTRLHVFESLCDFPQKFVLNHNLPEASDAYDDEDLEAWGFEAQRWGRLLFLKITEELQLEPLVKFLQDYGIRILRHNNHMERGSAKYLILLLSLIQELTILQGKHTNSVASHLKVAMLENSDLSSEREASIDFEKIYSNFTLILEKIVLFAKSSCSIFWAKPSAGDEILPHAVTGKLGGPSRRRLSSSMATAILNAILSMRTIASISSWCAQLKDDSMLDSALAFLWSFSWKVILSLNFDTEAGAEVRLAAYEALAPVLKAINSARSPLVMDLILAND